MSAKVRINEEEGVTTVASERKVKRPSSSYTKGKE